MKIVSSVLLTLLCSSNARVSSSFLASQPPFVGSTRRSEEGRTSAVNNAKATKLFYSRDFFGGNKFHQNYNSNFNGYSVHDNMNNNDNFKAYENYYDNDEGSGYEECDVKMDHYGGYYEVNHSKVSNDYLHQVNDIRGGGGYSNYNTNGSSQPTSNNNNNSNNYGTLNSLSVSELKRLLDDRDVDYRDCLEKRDLIDRLLNSRPSSSINDYPGYSSSGRGSGGLSQEENRVVNTFTRASPSVAYIQTMQQQQVVRGFSLKGTEVPTGAGSGFLWDDKGHIVTNYHVIASATKSTTPRIKVKLQGMDPLDATIVGYEPEKDLAVLKISSSKLPPPLSIGSSSDLQVGQNVLAIGNPFGLDYTLTTGVVSALGRDVDGIGGRPIKGCVQTDAAINPGNSGGPLLDSRGRLIGVNMAIYSPSGASAGIGFSIPVDTVRRTVNAIIRHGKVVRPSLGINVADDRVLRSIEMQLRKRLSGVLVVEVIKSSPAEDAGIKASVLNVDGTIELGDLITEVDGEKVVSVEDLLSVIEAKSEGDWVSVKIWRKCDARLAESVRVKLTSSNKLAGKNSASSNNRKRSMSSSVGSFGDWQ